MTFEQATAERIAQARGGSIAVVINDQALLVTTVQGEPTTQLALRTLIGGPDLRAGVE